MKIFVEALVRCLGRIPGGGKLWSKGGAQCLTCICVYISICCVAGSIFCALRSPRDESVCGGGSCLISWVSIIGIFCSGGLIRYLDAVICRLVEAGNLHGGCIYLVLGQILMGTIMDDEVRCSEMTIEGGSLGSLSFSPSARKENEACGRKDVR